MVSDCALSITVQRNSRKITWTSKHGRKDYFTSQFTVKSTNKCISLVLLSYNDVKVVDCLVYQKCRQEAGLLQFYVNGHRIKLFGHLRRTEIASACNVNVSLKQSFESKLKTANCYNDRSDRSG